MDRDYREVKNLFEEIYQKAFDTKFLDDEDDERTVRKSLDFIESKISSRSDHFVSLTLYPNIGIVKKFIEKWNIGPIYEGSKWLVFISSDSLFRGLEGDLDIYDDAFAWCRVCDKTYNYYEDRFKEDEDISSSSYQYPQFLTNSRETNQHEMTMKSFDNSEIIEELRTRTFSPKEIREILRIFE